MERYDAEKTPEASEWLALDEGERILLAERYHRDARIRMPQRTRRLHASIHTAVENQLAEKYDPTVRALERLLKDGPSRHEAVHAVGSCVSELIYNITKSQASAESSRERFEAAVQKLTAQSWRASFEG